MSARRTDFADYKPKKIDTTSTFPIYMQLKNSLTSPNERVYLKKPSPSALKTFVMTTLTRKRHHKRSRMFPDVEEGKYY